MSNTELNKEIKRGRGRPRKTLPQETNEVVQETEQSVSEKTEEVLSRFELEQSRKTHKTRIPIHRHRDILETYNIPEGFIGRWVKDLPGRIEKFLEAGWEMLTLRGIRVGEGGLGSREEVGDVITRHAGPNDGYTLYLMVIERELYDMDQAAKQAALDEVDRAMEAEIHGEHNYGDVRSKVTY